MPAVTVETLITAFGWIGAVGAVTAYAMVSTGRWSPKGLPFQLTNLISAVFMAVVAGHNSVWPSVAANLVWIAVGVQTVLLIGRTQLRRARERRTPAITESDLGLAA